MKEQRRFVLLAWALITVHGTPLIWAEEAPVVTPIYKSDFTKDLDPAQWGKGKKLAAPGGGSIVQLYFWYCGAFTQKKLPKHEFVRAKIDVVVIGTADGSDPKQGPDNWTVQVRDGPLLLLTNFRNPGDDKRGVADGIGQAYPDEFPFGLHASQAGAKRFGKFGPGEFATYRLELVFPHTAPELVLDFQSGMRNHKGDESWGISSMQIETISGPQPRSEAKFSAMWKALSGDEALAANRAVWEFVASGKKGLAYLTAQFEGADPDDKAARAAKLKKLEARVAGLMVGLDAQEFKERVEARVELKKLSADAIPILEKKLAANPPAGVRSALKSVLKSLRAQVKSRAGGGKTHKLVGSRVGRVKRILEYADLGMTITVSNPGSIQTPKGSAADGFVPEKMTGPEVPRHEWRDSRGGRDEWIQYEFAKERTLDFAEVFWFVSTTWDQGAKLPASWSLTYRDGNVWKPVKAKGAYGIKLGEFNRVEFDQIKTRAIRLNAKSTKTNHIGVFEFRVGETDSGSE